MWTDDTLSWRPCTKQDLLMIEHSCEKFLADHAKNKQFSEKAVKEAEKDLKIVRTRLLIGAYD